MTRFFTAFPDFHVIITDLVAEGDKVVLWYTVRGTHRGEFEGFRPSGKLVNWSGSDLLRIAGGKIVEGRFLDDLLGLLRQIGELKVINRYYFTYTHGSDRLQKEWQ